MTLDLARLAPMDVAGRLGRLQSVLADHHIDSLVVTNLVNIAYLTGFTGSAGTLVVSSDTALLITDGRYTTQSHEQVEASGADLDIVISAQPLDEVASRDLGAIGCEADSIALAAAMRLTQAVGRDLTPTSGVVEMLRSLKDAGEIARIQAAATIATTALHTLEPMLSNSPSEIQFAQALDAKMRELGASSPSFETIVASGPHSALPHARPTQRLIGRGEPVVIDFGARVDGYCSDMTRTRCVGTPDDEMRNIFDAVAHAQRDGVAAIRDGVAAAAIDAACRTVLTDAGLSEYFTHGTGHGVGLDIHEHPRIAASSSDVVETGQVVTVEPGVYVPGRGGVRIEDAVVVTEVGCDIVTTANYAFDLS